ncbi:MAG: hypothetical protein KME11_23125 [Timaviella obliquedivisa GSE-PSE-MK23-08B]|jgi:hypothetical protein|nr:hypothetical protein [Timaviella obliquedivisa GSE-PSE-MK23-08B]
MSHKSLFQAKNISRMLIGGLFPLYSFLLIAMPAHAEEQMYNFTVTNDTENTITELYVDDADQEEWGDNIVYEAIAPGETASFEWADEDVEEGDPCMYHVRAVFEDDSVAEEIEDGIDFCENPEVFVSVE